jgi:hypothetical protein
MVPAMDVEKKLRDCVDTFVADLDLLMRRAALEALEETFGNNGPLVTGRGARPGAKRSPAQLEELQDQLLETITVNPGLRIEALSEVMEVPSRDLTLPIKKLLAARKIKKKGQKRATAYYAR